MADAHKNFAYSTVATAPSPASSGTSLVVAAGEGTKFPATPFNVTIWPAGTQPSTANAEIARVTNIATDTFTITRAQEGSSARTVIVGDQIAATITAKTLTDAETTVATDTIWDTKGDLAVATGADAAAKLAIGTAGQLLGASNATPKWIPPRGLYKMPSGALASTIVRDSLTGAAAIIATGTLYLNAIELYQGMVISNILVRTGGTGMATGTHQWMTLHDSNRVMLAITSDPAAASSGWAASTDATLPIANDANGAASTFTITADGLYYLGLMITAGTMPNIVTGSISANAMAPLLCGTSNTSQTARPSFPFTATAITAATNYFLMWVS